MKGDRVVVDWEGYTIGYYGRPFQTRNKVRGYIIVIILSNIIVSTTLITIIIITIVIIAITIIGNNIIINLSLFYSLFYLFIFQVKGGAFDATEAENFR